MLSAIRRSPVSRFPAFMALLVGVALLASSPSPTLAAGSSSDDPAPKPSALSRAQTQIDRGDYDAAIITLEAAKGSLPRSADLHNLLGFAHRKLGHMEESYLNYRQALAIDPDHRGAHEYIGEYYLQNDDLPNAKLHLAALDRICIFGCSEYTELKKAVAAYETGHRRRLAAPSH